MFPLFLLLLFSHFLDFLTKKLYHNSMDIWVQLAQFSCFQTERLRMRPFAFAQDHDWFYDVASNPQNLPYIFPVTVSKRESDCLFVNSFIREPLGIWALEHQKSQRLVGMIGLEKIDVTNKTAEIVYFTHCSVWGQGFATEALKALSFLAFYKLGLKTLHLVTHVENIRSQRVAEQAGFRLVKQFKGSDRYSRKTRHYLQFELSKGGYRYE